MRLQTVVDEKWQILAADLMQWPEMSNELVLLQSLLDAHLPLIPFNVESEFVVFRIPLEVSAAASLLGMP